VCGLVAWYSEERPVQAEALHRAVSALRHRGPDGEGLWVSGDRRVALGHRRLALVDVAGGAQPLSSEDGAVRAIVNGELYGHERLLAELEARGHRFRTRSDSEVLVHLYEEHGAGCLRHLRGEFAFVLWDGRNRLLLAGRDRFGVKPLCYAQVDGGLWLASEAKALLAAGLPATWDEGAFFHAASLQYVPPDRTLFAGVRQVPPGHVVLAVDGHVRVRRYWDLDVPRLEGARPVRTEAEWVEGVRERLEEAVRLRLRGDVPVAFQLSGGLDSSAVVGLAAREVAGPVHCFTLAFEAEGYDELALAEETAARVGAVLHPVRVGQEALVEGLPEAVAQGEGLAINGHLMAKHLLSRAVREAGFKVVLTGEGSDEVFAGYPHLRRDLLLEGAAGPRMAERLGKLEETNLASAGVQLPEGESLPLEAVRRALGFVPGFLEAKGTLGRRVHGVLTEEYLRRFEGRDAYAVLMAGVDVEGQLEGRHRVEQSLYLWTKLALANYILRTLGDGMEMAHGVEGRLPFLDGELYDFARAVPMELKIRGPVEKYVLREAMRPYLTEAVYRRQKHPLMAPPLTLFGSARAQGLVQDVLRSRAFQAQPFFEPGKVLALLERLPTLTPRERVAQEPVLMMALTTALLQERYRLSGV
jgi:asparagine synthase (glutamine-hydrolysing)